MLGRTRIFFDVFMSSCKLVELEYSIPGTKLVTEEEDAETPDLSLNE